MLSGSLSSQSPIIMTYAKASQWRYIHRNADVCDIIAKTVRKLVWKKKKCWRCGETQNHPKKKVLCLSFLRCSTCMFKPPLQYLIISLFTNHVGYEVPREITMSVNMWQMPRLQEDERQHSLKEKKMKRWADFRASRMFLLIHCTHSQRKIER